MPEKRVYSTPFVGIADLKTLEEDTVSQLVKTMMDLKKVSKPEDLAIRDILPSTDLGLTNETWTVDLSAFTANSWNQWINKTVHDLRAIGIYAVYVSDPNSVTGIKFCLSDTEVKTVITTQKQATIPEGTKVIALPSPVIYSPKESMKVYLYATTATGTADVVLIGKVADASGEVVTV